MFASAAGLVASNQDCAQRQRGLAAAFTADQDDDPSAAGDGRGLEHRGPVCFAVTDEDFPDRFSYRDSQVMRVR